MAYKPYDTSQRAGESLAHYYKRLAKVADQRLVRLEKLSQKHGFEGASKWAYNRAQKDIARWGEGSRFNTKAPANTNSLKAKINDIKAFLGSATSTKAGITDVYEQRANTINQTYGTNFTWQDIAKFYGKQKNVALDAKYGSKTVAMAIGIIQQEMKNGRSLEEMQKLARARSASNYYEFAWTNKKGEKTSDFVLDEAVHRILRSKSDIAAMYDILIRHA